MQLFLAILQNLYSFSQFLKKNLVFLIAHVSAICAHARLLGKKEREQWFCGTLVKFAILITLLIRVSLGLIYF